MTLSSNVKTIKFNNTNLNNKHRDASYDDKNLRNLKMNGINNKNHNKIILNQELNQIEKHFNSKLKEKNNSRKREIEDLNLYMEEQEKKNERRIGNDNAHNNNEIVNNLNINFSNVCILNKNNSDPHQIQNSKHGQK